METNRPFEGALFTTPLHLAALMRPLTVKSKKALQPKPWSNSSSPQALELMTLNPLVTILGDISAAECLIENGQ
ncbi:hypothetical protein TNCV_1140241 [Trichonephila clavipes]|nr:hypothetical protein TNCV_1140241 [Trichonephila clavipes]